MSLKLQCSRSIGGPSYALCALRQRSYGPAATLHTSMIIHRRFLVSERRQFSSRDPSLVSTSRARCFSTYTALYASSGAGQELANAVASKTSFTGSIPVEPATAVKASSSVDLSTFESSAQAKWASDALTELAPQGDLASLGLCANTPVGWLQYMIEYVHIHANLPWWGAVVASTFILRAVIFPVVMKIQKNGVVMNNINPELQKLMKRQKEYRQMGNKMLADQYSHKIWAVYQKHNCNPLKMAVMPLIQLPLFLSFFIAIRKMAAVPVESMKSGGALWFTDLTVPDPYYILPVLACGSFVASIEVHMKVCVMSVVYESA